MQITFTLPDNVPDPKFQLFQRVAYYRKGTKPATGVVVGMEYVDFATALLNDLDRCGWTYTVNLIQGLSQQEILSLKGKTIDDEVWEDDCREAA